MNIEDLPDYSALCEVQNALWGKNEVRGAAVMIGAGFSRFADRASATGREPPLWSDFSNEMMSRLYPSGGPQSDPLKLAEEYKASLGGHALEALIRHLVPDDQWTPGNLHKQLLSLPWSDILTTNWDTLLERTAQEHLDRVYEVVRVPADIARTRSPRVVKLHGTLPSHAPFIFTEEDFRTYPVEFAPFVNLAQQVLLENELCLVGFSGDDPNFLRWSGWVRDQLGKNARPIRLVGVLNLSPSKRQVLEKQNVSPIDLGPLVAHLDASESYNRATEIFLQALQDAKPKPDHIWERKNVKFDPHDKRGSDEIIDEVLSSWSADREVYPGWLIAPPHERKSLRHETEHQLSKLKKALPKVSDSKFVRVAVELAWRHEVSLLPLGAFSRDLFQRSLEPDKSEFLSGIEQAQLLKLLAVNARRSRKWTPFECLISDLEKIGSDEACAEANYQRALRAFEEFDYSNLSNLIPKIMGTDPVWAIRRASLHAAMQETTESAETIRAARMDIKKRLVRERNSIWLISRDAWAAWLMDAVRFELKGSGDALEHEDSWPTIYKESCCDPGMNSNSWIAKFTKKAKN